jgi:glutathione synthase/RimK-type ligase-like ATP-grasp enzyme
MSSHSSQTTTKLEDIKQWAEERGGKPAVVKSTENSKEGGGVLRINFPGYSGEDTLEEISWEEWYKVFQERNLAFLYQEETAGGKESRFFKLVANDDSK